MNSRLRVSKSKSEKGGLGRREGKRRRKALYFRNFDVIASFRFLVSFRTVEIVL